MAKPRNIDDAYERLEDLNITIREHVVGCRAETRMQNDRLARLEKIFVAFAGASMILLCTIILQGGS